MRMSKKSLAYYELELRNCQSAITFGLQKSVTMFELNTPLAKEIEENCRVLLEKVLWIDSITTPVDELSRKEHAQIIIDLKNIASRLLVSLTSSMKKGTVTFILMGDCTAFFGHCLDILRQNS
jgi:hypothetical protein